MSNEPTTTTPDGGDEVIRIRLVRKEKKIRIEDETGTEREYTIREMTGANRDRWLTKQSGRARYDSNGRPAGVSKFDNIQAELIAMCLYDESNNLVPEKTIAQWPTTVQDLLFEMSEGINGLDKRRKEAEEEAKNG